MGISSTQYKDIMYQYDQTRMKNQRKLDERYETLYKKFPELKEIHDHLVELSIRQARMEVLNPESAFSDLSLPASGGGSGAGGRNGLRRSERCQRGSRPPVSGGADRLL